MWFVPAARAQAQDSATRYADAYKAYASAACPIAEDGIRHFVYFARDREAIHDHPFLAHDRFVGAQIMYPWAKLEVGKGQYDFSLIEEDYEFLRSRGKVLFVQLQDVSFNPQFRAVPQYLAEDAYDGGALLKLSDDGTATGWIAKRWNERVRERFGLLLRALGDRFDGRIEGINLQETAIEITVADDTTFSPESYVEAIKANMLALKDAFPHSTTMQYANFLPGEWLPRQDRGYLRSIYRYGESIGVGLGAPDLMVWRQGQLNHALAMMHEGEFNVPLGIAVQDGNYVGLTGSEVPDAKGKEATRRNIVPLLQAFAAGFLRLDYMFWVNQSPYFEEDVLPCFPKAAASSAEKKLMSAAPSVKR